MPTSSVSINATISSLIKPGSNSPLQLSSPDKIRNTMGQRLLGQPISQALSSDLDNIRAQINTLNTKAQTPPTMTQLLLTNAQGQVVAAVGNITYNGVPYNNYFNEIHVGNPLNTLDPAQALFNAYPNGEVAIGQNGWIDVHDYWQGNAAWIGTQFETLPITGAFNNGAGMIRLQVNKHTLKTGNSAEVRNMQFAGVPNATGTWPITVIDGNTVDLAGSVWAGSFVLPTAPGGVNTKAPTIDRILQITGCSQTPGGTTIRLSFNVPTGYQSGTSVTVGNAGGVPNATGQWIIGVPPTLNVTNAVDNGTGSIRLTAPGGNFKTGDQKVQVRNVGGVPNADGFWEITAITPTEIDLIGSFFTGTYTSGGTITFTNANLLDLAQDIYTDAPSIFAGAYTGGGTCLEYYAGMLAQTIAIGESFQNYKLRAFPSGDLYINNANITLTSDVGQIIFDPNTSQIILTNYKDLSSIILDATVPSITLYDQTGKAQVTMEILQEPPLQATGVSIASPAIFTVPGNTYVNGDTVLVTGATVNKNLLGYRIVEGVNATTHQFHLTDLNLTPINTSAPETGIVFTARYYAGLLAQTIAIGESWSNYQIRLFADGQLVIKNAAISGGSISNVTVSGFTSVGGTAPNTITLTIDSGLISIASIGTQAGKGIATFDQWELTGQTPAPTAPLAGKAILYYDTGATPPGLYYNLGGAGWVALGGSASSVTSVGGTAPNTITLTINNGLISIVSAGTALGKGIATFDQWELTGQTPAPLAPTFGRAILYYDVSAANLYYNLGGAGWIGLGTTVTSFTPVIQVGGSSAGITFTGLSTSSRVGTGTGSIVTVILSVNITAWPASPVGNITISGFPVNPSLLVPGILGPGGGFSGLTPGGSICPQLGSGGVMNLFVQAATGRTQLPPTAMGAGTFFQISITYPSL